ncbi:MAG: DHHW family protein [Cellulosilyticaceae bacterium]
MNKRFHIAMALSFVVYIGGFFSLQILAKDKEFSDLENRGLQMLPNFTMERFLEGKFGTDFEKYIADQFPGRNTFIALKSHVELALQKKDNNGVYIGKDGYFLQEFKKPDEELMAKNIDYVNRFAEKANVYFMLAPTATKVHEDRLPSFATPYDEGVYIKDFTEELSDKVHLVDALSKLSEHKEEAIYYKTDHHWTTLGAYYGYTAFCEAYGIEPLAVEDFERLPAGKDFYGTLFSKGNFTFATPDVVEIFEPKQPVEMTVTYVNDEKVVDSLYEMSHLEKKDKYSVFLDGNHAMIEVKTNANNGKKLAVVKDSYANAMMPFLAQHFEEIYILDLRFLNASIPSYLEERGIEDVLMLYNVQNFATLNKLSLIAN